jgi:hypothetical protein
MFVLALAVCAAAFASACGDDDGGGGEDPTEVLTATFANDETIDSGVFELTLDYSTEGGSDDGSINATVGGPFQGSEGSFPSFDIEAEGELDSESQDISGNGGLTSTGDAAFVAFQGTEYEIPAEIFSQFASTYGQLQRQAEQEAGDGGASNLLSSLGVNPTNWLTETENEGNEDVEGTDTVHISGQADVPKLVEDLKTLSENVPDQAQQVNPADSSQLDSLADVIESADFDIYTGADDDILRKIEADMVLKPDDVEGAPDSVDLNFALTFSQVNEPQEIAAPSDPQPLQGLLDQLGIDPAQLGLLGAAIGSGAGGSADTGTTAPPAGAPAPSSSASQAYLECLSTASGADAIDQCAELLE